MHTFPFSFTLTWVGSTAQSIKDVSINLFQTAEAKQYSINQCLMTQSTTVYLYIIYGTMDMYYSGTQGP